MTPERLVALAKEAMPHAYAPYSGYKVGAALLSRSGRVFSGCNVENAAYGPTNCAERTAFFKAVSEGEREFSAIAVVGGKDGNVKDLFVPCGVCRQVMAEFCDGDFEIINVCGSNKRAKARIDNMIFNKKVINLGFVDYVDQIMDAADIIVTKPGGLTTSEAMAKSLPMVIVNPIPGQEDRNTEFLVNNGCAMAVSPTYELEEIIYTLTHKTERLKLMRDSIALFAHPDSTRRICDFSKSLYNDR